MGKIFFPQYIKGRKKGVLLAKGKSILTHIKELGGVEIDTEQGEDIVRIVKGSELLSPLSAYEKEMISNGRLKEGQRLASHAKIIDDTSDVVVFMSSFGKYTILTDIIV